MEMIVYYLVRIKDGVCTYSAGPFATFEDAEEARLFHRWTANKYTVKSAKILLDN